MKKGQTHPAALTSKILLSDALIQLLGEKEYKSITITEICARSQIARRTFYRNFNTTDDVLIFFVKKRIDEFIHEMNKHTSEPFLNILIAYFTFWNNHSSILLLLSKNGLTHIIFFEYIQRLPEIPFLCSGKSSIKTDHQTFPCILAFTAGGLWSLLTYWLYNNCAQTPQQLALIIIDNFSFADDAS